MTEVYSITFIRGKSLFSPYQTLLSPKSIDSRTSQNFIFLIGITEFKKAAGKHGNLTRQISLRAKMIQLGLISLRVSRKNKNVKDERRLRFSNQGNVIQFYKYLFTIV